MLLDCQSEELDITRPQQCHPWCLDGARTVCHDKSARLCIPFAILSIWNPPKRNPRGILHIHSHVKESFLILFQLESPPKGILPFLFIPLFPAINDCFPQLMSCSPARNCQNLIWRIWRNAVPENSFEVFLLYRISTILWFLSLPFVPVQPKMR